MLFFGFLQKSLHHKRTTVAEGIGDRFVCDRFGSVNAWLFLLNAINEIYMDAEKKTTNCRIFCGFYLHLREK